VEKVRDVRNQARSMLTQMEIRVNAVTSSPEILQFRRRIKQLEDDLENVKKDKLQLFRSAKVNRLRPEIWRTE